MLPWRAVELLEEATRLGLLRRAGSGHLFPHRLLMEHLAELPAAPGRELATTSTG